MSGVVAILGAVLLLAIILRLGTAALVVTGLAGDVARFQVRSAFFGVGFTTSEAEMIVTHPARRRLIQSLMLLGSVGITGVIGSAVLTFARNKGSVWLPIVVLVLGLVLLWALTSWQLLDRFLTRRFERVLRRWTDLDTHDYSALLRLSSEYAVRQLSLAPGGRLDGQALADVLPHIEGVVLLGIAREDGTYLGAPPLSTVLLGGDTVTVYGRDEALDTLSGPEPR
jgi:hypothetical protein